MAKPFWQTALRLGAENAARLSIVRVYSTDLERGQRFYEGVFGMHLAHTYADREIMMALPEKDAPGFALVVTDPQSPHPKGGFVVVVPDIDRVMRAAPELGGAVTRPVVDVPSGNLRIGFVTDPDGTTIEIVQPTTPGK